MAVTPTNNVWQYVLRLSRLNQKAMITTYLRNEGTPANTDYTLFCQGILQGQELASGVFSLAKALLSDQWELSEHSLQAVDPIRYVAFRRTPGGAVTEGTRVGTALPINTQVAVQRRTVIARRSGQGVLKPPFGVTGDTVDGGNWTAGFQLAVKEWGDKMISTWVGLNPNDKLTPIIWGGPTGNDRLDFIDCKVESTVRVIRRRTVGVGQ